MGDLGDMAFHEHGNSIRDREERHRREQQEKELQEKVDSLIEKVQKVRAESAKLDYNEVREVIELLRYPCDHKRNSCEDIGCEGPVMRKAADMLESFLENG